jgi:hypothetical protein
VFVKKVNYKVKSEVVTTKAGIFKVQLRVEKARPNEEGYDPIKEAIEKKMSMKPPEDLN